MFKFKNSASSKAIAMLKKCQGFCDIEVLKEKVSNNKKTVISAAMVVIIVLVFTLFAANYRVGYKVKVEDVVLGTVATKGEYYEVLDEVKTEVNNISEIEFEPVLEEEFSVEIVSVDSFTQKEELAENVKALSEGMVEAYTITADGQFVVALNSEEEANRLKDEYLDTFKSEDEDITVSYGAEVKVDLGHVPQDTVRSLKEAQEIFAAGEIKTYTVAENDTLESIADVYDVLEGDILKDNEIEEITTGMTLKIYTGQPIIPIKTIEYINGEIDIPYTVEKREDATIYEGQTRVYKEGVNGKKYLHAYITKINGIITQENVIESQVLKEPVAQVELVGTKEPPSSSGSGKFIMPTSGRLTSTYGRRWGRSHDGIDVAATTGTPIYAADNGIIVESEYQKNGYGNIIKIDHQNGFISYYAHCSKLYANVGDVVAKGDLIATVGSTGRSTGPHLHFEIRYNDVPQNPYNYVK